MRYNKSSALNEQGALSSFSKEVACSRLNLFYTQVVPGGCSRGIDALGKRVSHSGPKEPKSRWLSASINQLPI